MNIFSHFFLMRLTIYLAFVFFATVFIVLLQKNSF